tara:strand:+ start:1462 stop:2280 length:819 start_codon:yes stop_codon:yes gene_type:complete
LKKIGWISSYPKSGNTYVRLFLVHYLYDSFDNLNFDLLKKIPKFEQRKIFENALNINFSNQNFDYIKYSIKTQEKLIAKNNQINLLFKTHHFYGDINNFQFTNKENSLFYIYLVRDPREVLVSFSNHRTTKIYEQIKFLTSQNIIQKNEMETLVNWGLHYRSWKSFKTVPNLFIKFEDLINDPFKNFKLILNFLSNYIEITIDEATIKKTIDTISFANLQRLEKNNGFKEAPDNSIFFRSGIADSWKKILSKDQISYIEKVFYEDMRDLNYL